MWHGQFFTRWPQNTPKIEQKTPLSVFSWKSSKIKLFSQNLVSCRSSKGGWIRWEYFWVHGTCFLMSKRQENVKIREKTIFFSIKATLWTTDFYTEKCCFFTNFCVFLTSRHRKRCSMHLKISPSHSATLTWPTTNQVWRKKLYFWRFSKKLAKGGFFTPFLGPPCEKVSMV